MKIDDTDLHHCEECGSEFVIQAIESIGETTFCPYCGHKLYDLDEDENEDEDDDLRSWD